MIKGIKKNDTEVIISIPEDSVSYILTRGFSKSADITLSLPQLDAMIKELTIIKNKLS